MAAGGEGGPWEMEGEEAEGRTEGVTGVAPLEEALLRASIDLDTSRKIAESEEKLFNKFDARIETIIEKTVKRASEAVLQQNTAPKCGVPSNLCLRSSHTV